ncbi:MAG: ATP-binding protein [Alkalilacustris sp.]
MTASAPPIPADARAVAAEMAWLARVIEDRITHFLKSPGARFDPLPPPPVPAGTALGAIIGDAPLDGDARLILALALAPHVQPAILDPFFVRNSAIDRIFTEFGGTRPDTGGFQPSVDTALFLVAGTDPVARILAMRHLGPDQPLRLRAGLATAGAALALPAHRAMTLLQGRAPDPDFSADFPAKRLSTDLEWNDLVVPDAVAHRLGHVLGWLEHETRIRHDWGLARTLGQGFRALFHGPPGTGKTLTAALLGKRTGQPVYRIDLSMVVSKYIGETEKNLAGVFDQAAERGWILFFDEADALFGNRSSGGTANDRHANQEVAYLLQRIEDCPGLVILATNLRGTIDEAFFRRFHAAILFPRPDARQRERLWQGMLGGAVPLDDDVNIPEIARAHDLSGGSINNVVRHAAVTALRRGAERIAARDIGDAVAHELQKEGRTP